MVSTLKSPLQWVGVVNGRGSLCLERALKKGVSTGIRTVSSWHLWSALHKVEKILKCSLDLISSPSVKIQIMGGKVGLKTKHC